MLDTVAIFHWSEANVALLRERYEAGVSTGRITDELGQGCTRNAVIGKIHRLGLTRDVTNVAGRRRRDGIVRQPVAAEPAQKAPAFVTPARPPRPPVIVEPEPPRRIICEPPGDGVLMHELEFGHCRWPLLDLPAGQGEEMRYCGGRRVARKIGEIECPYCDEHAQMAYASPRSAEQREADERRRQARLQRKRIAA